MYLLLSFFVIKSIGHEQIVSYLINKGANTDNLDFVITEESSEHIDVSPCHGRLVKEIVPEPPVILPFPFLFVSLFLILFLFYQISSIKLNKVWIENFLNSNQIYVYLFIY
jgi:hypothetical protein